MFLRELVSNANDAIEKWRVVSLGDGIVDPNPLNITLTLVPGVNDKPGRLVITGMLSYHDVPKKKSRSLMWLESPRYRYRYDA